MERQRKNKIILVIVLLSIIAGITVAFATLSTQLQINGVAKVEPGKWEIKFENLEKLSLTGDASEVTAPEIVNATTIEDFEVVLTKPGDSITYTFDVCNNGSINAELEILTKAAIPTFTGLATEPTDKESDELIVASNFAYILKYTDSGDIVSVNDLLEAGTTKNMTLTLAYNGSSLPSDDVEISDLGITLVYVQN